MTYHRNLHHWRLTALLATIAVTLAAAQERPRRVAPASATIEIDASTVANRISPLLYGQFAEFMYQDVKFGLHAELLHNRGFEEPAVRGLSRGWERYPDERNDDYGLSCAWDGDTAYPDTSVREGTTAPHSLRLQVKAAVIVRHGVFQPRVPVRAGITYRGYVWAKTTSFSGRLSVALEKDTSGGQVYADVALPAPTGEWTKLPFTLTSRVTDPLARFAILVEGEGTAWIDQVSLMPEDAVGVVRADVWQRVKALRPAFLRWPGGNVAQDYHWEWGVGPRDTRPTWVNLSWNDELESGDFGTDEYIDFVRSVGAEPSLTVNVEGRGATAAEAAQWVEYCNGPASSRYGALRARSGHPEPFHVKFWEVGNEIWGDWVRGHSEAATYARNFERYAAAMRAVDPSIHLIAVGDNDLAWNRTVLGARERAEYLAVHHYYSRRDMENDVRNLLARPLHYDRWYGEMKAVLAEMPADRRPQLAINEWGLDLPERQQYSIVAALYGARLMNVFERNGDTIGMSAVSDVVNGWPGGIIQASRHRVFVTPTYLVNQLYASHPGAERLDATVTGPTVSTSKEGANVPMVDATVSRSASRRQIFIKAVNTDLDRAVSASIRVRGARAGSRAVVQRVVAPSLDAMNSFATPDAVRIEKTVVPAGARFRLVLPAHSVSVVTLDVVP